MRKMTPVLLFVCALFWSAVAYAQDDSPSLGDLARQTRQQTQQKEAQAAKEAESPASPSGSAQANEAAVNTQASKTAKRVITNDEIPEHTEAINAVEAHPSNVTFPRESNNQIAAEQVKSQILRMKNSIASLHSQITNLEQSVHYPDCNGFAGCVQRNERQQQKQQRAEAMKQQLEQQQKNLERMQEMARRQGYGSSVYDP